MKTVSTEQTITLNSIVSASKFQASSEMLGESVILELKSGVYYGLNETGSLIWNLIQQSKSLEEIRDILLNEYEVNSELCTHYMLQLVQDLVSKGLVIVEEKSIA